MSATETDNPVSIVWERPHEEDAIRGIREANERLTEADEAAKAARDELAERVWEANRKFRVTQQTIGDELGVTKSRVNSIINEYDEQQKDTP